MWRRLKNVCKVAELGGGGVRVPAQIHLNPKPTSWSASKPGPQSLQVEHVNNHAASWTVGKAHGAWGGALHRAGHADAGTEICGGILGARPSLRASAPVIHEREH